MANKSNPKLNKLLADQGREFYNKLMQEWLDSNNVLMYSSHNEGYSDDRGKLTRSQLIIANLILVT